MNKTEFEHKFKIGDTVFLTFFSKGKYRVRKKTGYKINRIRFSLYEASVYFPVENGNIQKAVFYWFEGRNPTVNMTEESALFGSFEEAQKYCDEKNKGLLKYDNL